MLPHEILQVPVNSCSTVIKKAYFSKIRKMHPDKGGDGDDFELVNDAYHCLKDNPGLGTVYQTIQLNELLVKDGDYYYTCKCSSQIQVYMQELNSVYECCTCSNTFTIS